MHSNPRRITSSRSRMFSVRSPYCPCCTVDRGYGDSHHRRRPRRPSKHKTLRYHRTGR